jgi:hypothetical protein
MHLCSAKKVPKGGKKQLLRCFFVATCTGYLSDRDNRIAIPTLYKTDLGCPSIKHKPRMALRKIA